MQEPPKGQELDDHYFGAIKPRVAAVHEGAERRALEARRTRPKPNITKSLPHSTKWRRYSPLPISLADHNQLTMEMMQKVAKTSRHGLPAPREALCRASTEAASTTTGRSRPTRSTNLLEPGETPYENAQFLLFLCAVIKAVDEYQDLLRISVASAGNDHRLGANEAPPAIVSMFLGTDLAEILEAIEKDEAVRLQGEGTSCSIGVHTLPKFPKDTTDRNRTSPVRLHRQQVRVQNARFRPLRSPARTPFSTPRSRKS